MPKVKLADGRPSSSMNDIKVGDITNFYTGPKKNYCIVLELCVFSDGLDFARVMWLSDDYYSEDRISDIMLKYLQRYNLSALLPA